MYPLFGSEQVGMSQGTGNMQNGAGAGEMDDAIVFIYTTAPSMDVARSIAGDLVTAGLIACANLLPGMEAVYEWEGAVQQETEVAMLLKTRAARMDAAMVRLAERHPYDTPAITSFAAAAVDARFASWIDGATPA